MTCKECKYWINRCTHPARQGLQTHFGDATLTKPTDYCTRWSKRDDNKVTVKKL